MDGPAALVLSERGVRPARAPDGGGDRARVVHVALISHRERPQAVFQRFVDVPVGAHFEGVEADAVHVEQLILQHVTHRAHLTGEAVAGAQLAGVGIAAPVLERREVDRHQRQMGQVRGQVGGLLARLQTHAHRCLALQQGVAVSLPVGQRHDHRLVLRQALAFFFQLARFEPLPAVVDDFTVENHLTHRPVP